ncbi:MAG: YIP1 family protein [Candidatus Zixiibacteriota bacterium]|nr:MAG: YIP1 family protein [candidate division Zixibacteria bacterium]
MDLVNRTKKILLTPAMEWEVIKREDLTTADMFSGYAVILAAIPAAAGFIGKSLVGFSFMGIHSRLPIFRGLVWAILYYLLSLAGVYLLGVIIDALAPSFGSRKDMNASLKIAVFSMSAAWIAGVFQIIPALSILSIFGLYSFYLLFIGMRSLKEVQSEKMVGYFVVTLIVGLFIYILIGVIVGAIALGGYAALSAF